MVKQTPCAWMLRLLWLVAAALALGACQSAPHMSDEARRAQVLREQGFVQTAQGWELQLSGKLLFGFDSDVVTDESRQKLLRMGRALSEVGVRTLRVDGHADDQGAPEYNERLSLRRAQAVAQVLVDSGIALDHIEVRGLGAKYPVAAGTSEAARQENRRVALTVPVQ